MSEEGKRALIAAVRKVVIAGLILLVVWLILLALRGTIPTSVIDQINQQYKNPVSYNSATWDWSRSLLRDQTVASMIGQYLGNTLSLIALIGLMSLIIAGILLFIGALIRRITKGPGWLVKLRGILRLILVSGGASIPLFGFSTILMFTNWWHLGMQLNSVGILFWSAFVVSFLPAWLLVQTGHGIMAKSDGNLADFHLSREVSMRLLIRMLMLVGLVIGVAILAEENVAQPGLGGLLMSGIFSRDFPIVVGVAWVFVIIVVLIKMTAGLLEVAYDYSQKYPSSAEQVKKESPLRFAIPKGWLIFSLALVMLIILVAIFAPLLAPYGMNEIHLMDRLSSPSAKYLLGTDQLGRDILSRLLYGIRIDVLIGLFCTIVLSVVAAGWGTLAAYFRKMNNWLGDILEDIVMLPREIICSFPWLVLLLFLLSLMTGTGIIPVALTAGLVMLPRATGMIQEAYRSAPYGISWLQGVLKAIPVVFFFTTAGVIIYVSTASYLGFGIPPGTSELGNILSSEGRQYLFNAPWIGRWPSLCLIFIILFWMMAGDALLERLGFRSKAVWSKTME